MKILLLISLCDTESKDTSFLVALVVYARANLVSAAHCPAKKQ